MHRNQNTGLDVVDTSVNMDIFNISWLMMLYTVVHKSLRTH